MKYEIYCDESRQDLLTAKKWNPDQYFLIGSLWLRSDYRQTVKGKILELKTRFSVHGEIKWQKISPAQLSFYTALSNLFVDLGPNLSFRCIAIDASKVDFTRYHDDDKELGFYKFYYFLINKWLEGGNEYTIFCDRKTNRDPDRLRSLRSFLDKSHHKASVMAIHEIVSRESLLIQVADFLLGAAGARLNESIIPGGAKDAIVKNIENKLGRRELTHTLQTERKFNIFVIDLDREEGIVSS